MLAHLGIDPDSRISMSVRPVLKWSADVRTALETQNAAMIELTGRGSSSIEIATPPAIPPDPIPPDWTPPPPPPPPPPLSAAAQELDRKARSLGVHVRLHVPTVEPRKLDTLIGNIARELGRDRWTTTCAALGPTRACGGESDSVMIVRDVAGDPGGADGPSSDFAAGGRASARRCGAVDRRPGNDRCTAGFGDRPAIFEPP
jgi:hypothetical protein